MVNITVFILIFLIIAPLLLMVYLKILRQKRPAAKTMNMRAHITDIPFHIQNMNKGNIQAKHCFSLFS